MKRTYQPSEIKKVRKHGFRKKRRTASGRAVLKARRRKGRANLAPSRYKK